MSTEHLLVFENDTHVLNSSVLPSKIQDCDQFESRKTPSRRCRTCTSHCLCLTQALIALLNIILFVALLFAWKSSKDCLSESNHSPAQHMLEYQPKYFDKYAHLGNNPFSQKPGAELDAAWHKLLTGMNIRVSEDWLQPYGAESVRLADGSGVLAQLGVYHELHCLKKLKRWNYRSHYYKNHSDADLVEEESHIEHCLEWLRMAVLCRSDITLTTFQWGGREQGSLETEYPIPRKCVNAEKILKWSEEHSVDISRLDVFERT